VTSINPVKNTTVRNSPETNFAIYRTSNELTIMDRVELNTCHCKLDNKKVQNEEGLANRVQMLICTKHSPIQYKDGQVNI
jgi:hypothetical protein